MDEAANQIDKEANQMDEEANQMDEAARLARKFSLVVRDFPPGCGSHASERREEQPRKRKVLSLSNIMERVPSKKFPGPSAMQHAASVTTASSNQQISRDRERVIESLNMFRDLCKQLSLQNKSLGQGERIRRVDLRAWEIMKNQGKTAHGSKMYIGSVPGIEVGDKFYYRIEMAVVGMHRPPQGGIDYMNVNGTILATSIVASSGADNMNHPNELEYVGEGGLSNKGKLHEDQKLVRGNLALSNSIKAQNHVRVVRKVTASFSDRELSTSTMDVFVYDGLYAVQDCKVGPGDHGRMVFKFKLKRIEGQAPIIRFRG